LFSERGTGLLPGRGNALGTSPSAQDDCIERPFGGRNLMEAVVLLEKTAFPRGSGLLGVSASGRRKGSSSSLTRVFDPPPCTEAALTSFPFLHRSMLFWCALGEPTFARARRLPFPFLFSVVFPSKNLGFERFSFFDYPFSLFGFGARGKGTFFPSANWPK